MSRFGLSAFGWLSLIATSNLPRLANRSRFTVSKSPIWVFRSVAALWLSQQAVGNATRQSQPMTCRSCQMLKQPTEKTVRGAKLSRHFAQSI